MDFRVPDFDLSAEMAGGADVAEAEIAAWLVEDGATVRRGDQVLELNLDKANVTIEAPASGTLRRTAQEGDLVGPGDVVATIEEA